MDEELIRLISTEDISSITRTNGSTVPIQEAIVFRLLNPDLPFMVASAFALPEHQESKIVLELFQQIVFQIVKTISSHDSKFLFGIKEIDQDRIKSFLQKFNAFKKEETFARLEFAFSQASELNYFVNTFTFDPITANKIICNYYIRDKCLERIKTSSDSPLVIFLLNISNSQINLLSFLDAKPTTSEILEDHKSVLEYSRVHSVLESKKHYPAEFIPLLRHTAQSDLFVETVYPFFSKTLATILHDLKCEKWIPNDSILKIEVFGISSKTTFYEKLIEANSTIPFGAIISYHQIFEHVKLDDGRLVESGFLPSYVSTFEQFRLWISAQTGIDFNQLVIRNKSKNIGGDMVEITDGKKSWFLLITFRR